MKKNQNWILVVFLLLLTMLWGCTEHQSTQIETQPSTPPPETLTIPEATDSGGYEIRTDNVYCCVVADQQQKYSCFQSDSGKKVEFYISPTELILLDITDGVTTYYSEDSNGEAQIYANPIARVFNGLRELDFQYIREHDGYWVYQAVTTQQIVESDQVQYTVYTLEMLWLDGSRYEYRYYVYADGSTLISAEAPSDINPRLDKDTNWIISVEDGQVLNKTTGEAVTFTVLNTEKGEAVSPDDSGETIEVQYSIFVYVDAKTKQISKLQYEDGAEVTVLYDVDITKPEITEGITEMNSETLQLAMMLVQSLETLI